MVFWRWDKVNNLPREFLTAICSFDISGVEALLVKLDSSESPPQFKQRTPTFIPSNKIKLYSPNEREAHVKALLTESRRLVDKLIHSIILEQKACIRNGKTFNIEYKRLTVEGVEWTPDMYYSPYEDDTHVYDSITASSSTKRSRKQYDYERQKAFWKERGWVWPYIYGDKKTRWYKESDYFSVGAYINYGAFKTEEDWQFSGFVRQPYNPEIMIPIRSELTPEITAKFETIIKRLQSIKKILLQTGAKPKTRLGFTVFPENAANVKVYQTKKKNKKVGGRTRKQGYKL